MKIRIHIKNTKKAFDNRLFINITMPRVPARKDTVFLPEKSMKKLKQAITSEEMIKNYRFINFDTNEWHVYRIAYIANSSRVLIELEDGIPVNY